MNAAALLHPSVKPKAVALFQNESCHIEIIDHLQDFQPDAALIFGGDGTVHRHLADLHRLKVPTLVVPSGSGNDFAKALGINDRAAVLKAWQQFCESGGKNVAEIDLGVIHSEQSEVLFCCVAGTGLDSMANQRANEMPAWLRGTAGYLLGAIYGIFRFEAARFTVKTPARQIDQPGLLVAIGNAHRYGHGMKITPQAELDDGLLDICFVGQMNRFKLLCSVPTIFFGAHLGIKQVQYLKAPAVRIESGRELDVYADGEYAGRTPVEISIRTRALKVIVPEGHGTRTRKVP